MIIIKLQFNVYYSIFSITQNIQFNDIKYEHTHHAHTHGRARINENVYN